MNTKIFLEREGYRFVQKGIIELNGLPDYRLQKKDSYTKKWIDKYFFDNQLQMTIAMEDIEYAKWLCNDVSYAKDTVKSYWNLILK